MYRVPSRIMLPQDAFGGWTPTPKNDNPASPTITLAVPKLASTINGALMSGSRCRTTMAGVDVPMATAAWT